MESPYFPDHNVSPSLVIMKENIEEGGYTIYLCNLGKLAKRGGGGYPQALPKVINLQGMLDLPKILVLIEKLPPRS